MKVSDFYYTLPKQLIAKYPNINRSQCRLLVLDKITENIEHCFFSDLTYKLMPGDLLVLNDTKVISARVYGQTIHGKKIEILIERILDDRTVLAYIKPSDRLLLGTKLLFNSDLNISAKIINLYNYGCYKLFWIRFDNNPVNIFTILNNIGHIPIPPYLKRMDEEVDYKLYQTVYGIRTGSIAAPTAGLHFDIELLNKLRFLGIEIAFITLHIGSATFQPVRVSSIEQHVMHDEYIEVSKEVVNAIVNCKRRKNRVIAVGTTVVKSLETAAIYSKDHAIIEPFSGYSKIFIFPGYKFQVIDALITNFHLPRSTLMMLVTAFGGYQCILNAYYEAIKEKYNFLSYGDAMFITNNMMTYN